MDLDLQSIQQARDLLRQAKQAQRILGKYSQQEIDRVVAKLAEEGYNKSLDLARLACEETAMGRVASKLEKNRFSTRNVYKYIRPLQTAGVVRRDQKRQVVEIATPMGVVVGIIPVTNPTSTALFKILIAIKARCAIVLSPHPRAQKCIQASATVMQDALEKMGAPREAIGCLPHATMPATEELMKNDLTDVILATGGSGLVKAAYSSGKPAIGVGPGNCPAFIERTADLNHAVRCLVVSQGFDWGTICASEQSVVIDQPIVKECLAEFQRQKAYLCNEQQTRALENLMPAGGGINPQLVGQSPATIAKIAGFSVPEETTILLVWQQGVGDEYPLSREKLAPILSLYAKDGWEAGCKRCLEVLNYGGMGHTLALHSRDQEVISRFALEKPAYRIVVNAPSSQGSVGFATHLPASMTLGCGSTGGNITSDNITPLHLLNIKRVALGKKQWFGDLATPQVALPKQVERDGYYIRDPFEDLPNLARQPYIGPHNKI